MSREREYYDVLHIIAHKYQTLQQLRRNAAKVGLTPEEHIDMAYENIQVLATNAIRGHRRPKEHGR